MPEDQPNGQNRDDDNLLNKPEAENLDTADTPNESASVNDSSQREDLTMPDPIDQQPQSDVPTDSDTDTVSQGPALSPEVAAFDSEPATQPPVAMLAMNDTTTSQPLPEKKSKKGLIIGLILGAILLMGLGGSAAAYNLWFQNPDKVLVDAAVNAMKAESAKINGTFVWQNDDASLTVTPLSQTNKTATSLRAKVAFKAKTEETKAFDGMTMDADMIYKMDGTVYFKLTDVKKNFDNVADALIEQQMKASVDAGTPMTDADKELMSGIVKEMYQPIAEKLDNQWIVIKADKKAAAADERKCVADVYKKLSNDDLANEVASAYRDNKFVTVKRELGVKDGSVGYELDLDEKKAEKFEAAFKKTSIGKALAKCSVDDQADDVTDKQDEDQFKSSTFNVWIDRWSHELTSIDFEAVMKEKGAGSLKGEFATEFNGDVMITTPKDAKTFDEIFEGFNPFGAAAATAASAESSEI